MLKTITAALAALIMLPVCTYAQTVNNTLAQLQAKGTTLVGGAPMYHNYIPRLGPDGKLSLTFLPEMGGGGGAVELPASYLVHVDPVNGKAGGTADGTVAAPFISLQDAINHAPYAAIPDIVYILYPGTHANATVQTANVAGRSTLRLVGLGGVTVPRLEYLAGADFTPITVEARNLTVGELKLSANRVLSVDLTQSTIATLVTTAASAVTLAWDPDSSVTYSGPGVFTTLLKHAADDISYHDNLYPTVRLALDELFLRDGTLTGLVGAQALLLAGATNNIAVNAAAIQELSNSVHEVRQEFIVTTNSLAGTLDQIDGLLDYVERLDVITNEFAQISLLMVETTNTVHTYVVSVVDDATNTVADCVARIDAITNKVDTYTWAVTAATNTLHEYTQAFDEYTNTFTGAETFAKSLYYYADPNLVPSPTNWFTFGRVSGGWAVTGYRYYEMDADPAMHNVIVPYEFQGEPVTTIASTGFMAGQYITNIVSGVLRVDAHAFLEYPALKRVVLPRCRFLGDAVFQSTKITSISLPECSYLGFWALRGTDITELTLPGGVTLAGGTFADCTSLTNLTFTGAPPVILDTVNPLFPDPNIRPDFKLVASDPQALWPPYFSVAIGGDAIYKEFHVHRPSLYTDALVLGGVEHTEIPTYPDVTNAVEVIMGRDIPDYLRSLPAVTNWSFSASGANKSMSFNSQTGLLFSDEAENISYFLNCFGLAMLSGNGGGNVSFKLDGMRVNDTLYGYPSGIASDIATKADIASAVAGLDPEEHDLKALRLYHYGDPDIVESPAEWFTFSGGVITGFSYAAGREHVVIPWEINGQPVVGIGNSAFVGKKAIQTVKAPQTVVGVGRTAFNACYSLTRVNLPQATSIGEHAFASCHSLTNLIIGSATKPTFGSNWNQGTHHNLKIYATNLSATGWSTDQNGVPVIRAPLHTDELVLAGTSYTDLEPRLPPAPTETPDRYVLSGARTWTKATTDKIITESGGNWIDATGVVWRADLAWDEVHYRVIFSDDFALIPDGGGAPVTPGTNEVIGAFNTQTDVNGWRIALGYYSADPWVVAPPGEYYGFSGPPEGPGVHPVELPYVGTLDSSIYGYTVQGTVTFDRAYDATTSAIAMGTLAAFDTTGKLDVTGLLARPDGNYVWRTADTGVVNVFEKTRVPVAFETSRADSPYRPGNTMTDRYVRITVVDNSSGDEYPVIFRGTYGDGGYWGGLPMVGPVMGDNKGLYLSAYMDYAEVPVVTSVHLQINKGGAGYGDAMYALGFTYEMMNALSAGQTLTVMEATPDYFSASYTGSAFSIYAEGWWSGYYTPGGYTEVETLVAQYALTEFATTNYVNDALGSLVTTESDPVALPLLATHTNDAAIHLTPAQAVKIAESASTNYVDSAIDLTEHDLKALRLYHYGDPDIVESPAEWFNFADGVITGFNYQAGREHVVIPWEINGQAVVGVGTSAFRYEYGGLPITSLIAPKTVVSIGNNAFGGCRFLTTVNLPSVTSIDSYAVFECESLTTINLPSVTSVSGNIFYRCESLTKLIIGSDIKPTFGEYWNSDTHPDLKIYVTNPYATGWDGITEVNGTPVVRVVNTEMLEDLAGQDDSAPIYHAIVNKPAVAGKTTFILQPGQTTYETTIADDIEVAFDSSNLDFTGREARFKLRLNVEEYDKEMVFTGIEFAHDLEILCPGIWEFDVSTTDGVSYKAVQTFPEVVAWNISYVGAVPSLVAATDAAVLVALPTVMDYGLTIIRVDVKSAGDYTYEITRSPYSKQGVLTATVVGSFTTSDGRGSWVGADTASENDFYFNPNANSLGWGIRKTGTDNTKTPRYSFRGRKANSNEIKAYENGWRPSND